MAKAIVTLIILIIGSTFQISFLPALGYPINNLNLVVSIIIFITAIINYEMGLWLAFGFGVILDLYSIYPFGLLTIAFLATAIGINLFFDNFFTNRSLYSLLALGAIGTVFLNMILALFNLINFFANPADNNVNFLNIPFLYNFLWQAGLNLAILALMFLSLDSINKKLKSNFILGK